MANVLTNILISRSRSMQETKQLSPNYRPAPRKRVAF